MLDCTACDFVNRTLPLDNGDMRQERPACRKENGNGSNTEVGPHVVAAVVEPGTAPVSANALIYRQPLPGPSAEPPAIDRSMKATNILPNDLCPAVARSFGEESVLKMLTQEEDEERQLYVKSLTSDNLTISTATTDDEYRYLPSTSKILTRTASSYGLLPTANSSEGDVTTTSLLSEAVALGCCKATFRQDNHSDQCIADRMEVDETSVHGYDSDDQDSNMASNHSLKMRNASYPELNTPEEIAFIEWNVVQNDMLKRGRCAS